MGMIDDCMLELLGNRTLDRGEKDGCMMRA